MSLSETNRACIPDGSRVELFAPPQLARADGRGICVDACLALEVSHLWAAGVTTTGCCCGHGEQEGYIGVIDADIPRMKSFGYLVHQNPCRPGDEDSFIPKSPCVAARTAQEGAGEPVPDIGLRTAIHAALCEYRLNNMGCADDAGEFYPLVDLCSNDGAGIETGEAELLNLADYLVSDERVAAALSPPDPQARIAALEWNGRVHDLKTWPEPFAAIRADLKPWDFRLNDRDYRVGDKLRLRDWSPADDDYTGEVEERLVRWILHGGQFGVPNGFAIMSLTRPPRPSRPAAQGKDHG
jgi:hypothetical protein